MKCINPIFTNVGMFRCGKCLACNATKVDERLKRMNQETKEAKQTLFITLTYDDEHVPNNGVNKDDLKTFIKELKKNWKCKYIGIGEYGGRNKRPHYHLITWLKTVMTTPSRTIEQWWTKGISSVVNVNDKQCNYIAKYHANKVVNEDIYTIKDSHFFYQREGDIINECMKAKNIKNEIKCNESFMIQSNGIGEGLNNTSELITNLSRKKYTLRNNKGRQTQIPRYNVGKLTPLEQARIKINQLNKQKDELTKPSLNNNYINAMAQYPEKENAINYYKQQKSLEWERKYQENVVNKKLHKGI